MALHVSVNLGFITNSSSAVTYVPVEVMQHERVRNFMKRYEVTDGFIGEDLWSRSGCASLLVTQDQVEAAREELTSDWSYPASIEDVHDGGAVLIYGDEYDSLVSDLADLCYDIASELGVSLGYESFN